VTEVFVDTSAIYAIVDADDPNHHVAAPRWHQLVDGLQDGTHSAVTHSGVVFEISALVQHRLGLGAVRMVHDLLLPAVEIEWVGPALHSSALTALLAADRRDVSLVDWTSFELMRSSGVGTAFAFDDDFARQGFSPW
jgi:uncharacterized protein